MKFESREQIETFEKLLDAHLTSRANFPIRHISLVKAYDALQDRSDGGRVFVALVDIVINLSLIWCDVIAESRAWGELKTHNLIEQPLLESETVFSHRVDLHRYASSFVFRYRALWDKAMGLLILYFAPERYEEFARAKSKRGTYRRIAEGLPMFPKEFLERLDRLLTEFESEFRTPEAHGTGALRKTLLSLDGFDPKQWPSPTLGHWNAINAIAHVIGGLFDPEKRAASVEADNAL